MYEKEWWVACVLQLDEDESAVKVNFLHPQGPSRSFRFPATPGILTVPIESILIKIDPKYTRTYQEVACTKRLFHSLSHFSLSRE